MSTYNRNRLGKMVRKDRVHRDVYTDPEIFEMEMDRIFGHSWLYMCHESEVPNPGDFVLSEMGQQPVVVVRHTDGKVYVLYNRCGHRGAVVENLPKGNTKHFRCCYHGWVFKTNGELATVPLKNGYPENFDLTDPMLGMVQVPKVDSYRGFVFACMDAKVDGLEAYLGGFKTSIDDICDRSPEGEVVVAGGTHKYVFFGNWKVQVENYNDLYHPMYSHESTVGNQGQQFKRRAGDEHGSQIVGSDGRPSSFWDQTGIWAFDHGHSYCGKMPDTGNRSGPVFDKYKRSMVKAYGKKRAEEILGVSRHNSIFYPNLCVQSMAQHVRVVKPKTIGRTEVWVSPILHKGVPDEMNQEVIRYLNITHSAASLIQTDDLEAFKRCQSGLSTQGSDWVVLARGVNSDHKDRGGMGGVGTSELAMRNQYRAWKNFMCAEA